MTTSRASNNDQAADSRFSRMMPGDEPRFGVGYNDREDKAERDF